MRSASASPAKGRVSLLRSQSERATGSDSMVVLVNMRQTSYELNDDDLYAEVGIEMSEKLFCFVNNLCSLALAFHIVEGLD
jgi:hypothetical protein